MKPPQAEVIPSGTVQILLPPSSGEKYAFWRLFYEKKESVILGEFLLNARRLRENLLLQWFL